jgi:hypothetical protein
MAVRYFQTDDRLLYVRDRQRFGKVIEELNAENTEGDDIKTSGDLHIYISVCASTQTPDEGGRIILGYTCSPWLQYNALASG